MKDYTWIETESQLNQLLSILNKTPVIAVDTEGDSLYSYFEKVCLVQISANQTDYIIDPLAVDITPLGPIFSNPHIEKIFHAAEYDIACLNRDYGFVFDAVFDTMIAARILGWPKCGLGNILKNSFQVKLNKRFQQYNWGRRPLADKARQYARMDTHYLHQLRELQIEKLETGSRLREARAAFKRVTRARVSAKVFNPNDFWRIRGAKSLKPEQQAILKALYTFRDSRARYADRPPFKIMTDSTMIYLAKNPPTTIENLKKSKGLNAGLVNRYGKQILVALNKNHPEPTPKRSNNHKYRLNDKVITRYEHLRNWRNEVAQKRGVEPDVILSNGVLKAIAQSNPVNQRQLEDNNLLGHWQLETYGQVIIKELRNCNS